MVKCKKGEASTKGGKKQVLTKPGPLTMGRKGEIPSSQSFSGTTKQRDKGKRKDTGFVSPSEKQPRTKRIYSSTSRESSERSYSRPSTGALDQLEKEEKFQQMYEWFQRQQHDRRYDSMSRHSQSRSRSGSRSYRSLSRHSSKSKSSRHSH